MRNRKLYILRLILLFSDILILNVSYVSAWFICAASWSGGGALHIYMLSFTLFTALWLVFAAATRLYTFKTLSTIEKIYRNTWRTIAAQAVVFVSLYYMLHQQHFHNTFLLLCYGIAAGLWILNRLLLTYITEFIFKKVVSKRKVLIVGDDLHSRQLAAYFDRNKSFYSLAGIFNNTAAAAASTSAGGSLYSSIPVDCIDFASQHQVTDIYATTLPEAASELQYLRDAAENKGMRLLFVASRHQLITSSYHRIGSIDAMPVLSLRSEPLLKPRNIARKRLFDLVFSTAVIVLVMSWLTPLLAIIIKLTSKGPVFFVQQRSGKDNEPFWCYKFRSMVVNERSDRVQATRGDSRITAIGAFMRRTSIDELPQFFNVWMGTMSVVGPRPHMLRHTEEYSAVVNKYLVRHYLKPGITGWAQVNGYRGETAEVWLMEKRVEYDIEYLENWSLMQDVKIIFMTIINALRGEENAR